jgi:hypothetical protein
MRASIGSSSHPWAGAAPGQFDADARGAAGCWSSTTAPLAGAAVRCIGICWVVTAPEWPRRWVDPVISDFRPRGLRWWRTASSSSMCWEL